MSDESMLLDGWELVVGLEVAVIAALYIPAKTRVVGLLFEAFPDDPAAPGHRYRGARTAAPEFALLLVGRCRRRSAA